MNIFTAFKTEKGPRHENEDACLVLGLSDLGGSAEALLVIADGMGGRASGAVASSVAVEAVRQAFLAKLGSAGPDMEVALREGILSANASVIREAGTRPELAGMGTTCVALAVTPERAFYAYMGDSRAYLLRDGQIRRLTEDHSFVAEKVRTGELTEEQARTSRFRNVITRAVGLDPEAQPDSGRIDLQSGDVLLLCTDGLTTVVADPDIADILCTSSTPDEACDRLVRAALKGGGRDNITVAIATCGTPARRVPAAAGTVSESQSKSRKGGSWVLPALLSLVLGVGIGLYPGYRYLPQFLQPWGEKPSMQNTQPDLTHAEYDDPVLLISHIPLQGKMLALDPKGFLYVVDAQGKLMKVDKSGRVEPGYLSRDTFGPSQIRRVSPMLATDSQGNLYISDPAGKKIAKFDSTGLFLTAIAEGRLIAPEALAVDEYGTIFLLDAGRLKSIGVRKTVDSRPDI